jgi:hypothetical protein
MVVRYIYVNININVRGLLRWLSLLEGSSSIMFLGGW